MISPELALAFWVLVCLLAFLSLRPRVATAVAILGSELLLPAAYEVSVPGLPDVTGARVGIACALLFCLLLYPRLLPVSRPAAKMLAFPLLFLLSTGLTPASNSDALYLGPRVLPAVSTYDTVSAAAGYLLDLVVPFYLGLCLHRSPRALRSLLISLVVAALLYSGLVLFELRMSPQLHRWLYGYYQHDFGGTKRLGGWRPMVFTQHGLALAVFLLSASLGAVALWRSRVRIASFPLGIPAAFLSVLTLACKSTAAIGYGLFALPLAALTRPRTQLRVAAAICGFVLLYPLLRGLDLLPTGPAAELARAISPERGQSLEFRFDNEDRLLARALERWLTGWGGWGRGRIYDLETGSDLSITDGAWIIVLGSSGSIGFLGTFGMVLAPVWSALRAWRGLATPRDRSLTAGLALIVAVRALDLLPNGFFMASVTLYSAGALAGSVSVARR